jgi:anaerobic selenocysteine-containing dehydrogenase
MLVVQDIFLTKTAELADVVLPASRARGRDRRHGHQQRAPRAARAQGARSAGQRRDDIGSSPSCRAAWARPGPTSPPRLLGRAARALAHARRHELRAARGHGRHPVAVPRRESSGRARFLHGRLWEKDPAKQGMKAPFSPVVDDPPGRQDHRRVPAPSHHRSQARLVQHRRADPRLRSPLRDGETIEISPAEARSLGVADDERVRVARAAATSWPRCASTWSCGPVSSS